MHIDTSKVTDCAYCGYQGELIVHEVKEMMFGTGELFHYGECPECKSLCLLDPPKDLSPYYPEDYYSFLPLVKTSSVINFLKKIRFTLFQITEYHQVKPVFGDWVAKIKPKKTARIADIGCGNGQLLFELYAAGFKNLTGVDPFMKESVRVNKYLSLEKKSIFEIEGVFDLVMIHHALEHMDHPQAILKRCFELMDHESYLLVRLPVTDSKVWKDEGVYWVQLDAPRHFQIPSVSGLKKLAEKEGFESRGIVFDSTEFQFWGTELAKEGKILSKEEHMKVFSKQDMARWRKKAALYNQKSVGDQASFYFYKP
ncbi:hypothetical protein A33Q_4104 [Indibacter alkaliphilus LW1]|uniref:Methyltransferase domain-containing protein n=1 Tax=Indibacter alkaliphilus (strain CCUG 57479 / KCTC 22604 / LW1) TaxID=1189612 RepID=S2DJ83_INDAL|nr:class I SAM-dependent methyltransferase [Indibacter alkaliphilus]EOZ92011.1 hypothetical protein A33Q_4104 [Indibacter alkaliphilus LW1]